jgi:hypothetical protein
MGGKREGHIDPKIRAAVLDAEIGFLSDDTLENIKGDHYPIEDDSGGYPELPACLDRRHRTNKKGAGRSRRPASLRGFIVHLHAVAPMALQVCSAI